MRQIMAVIKVSDLQPVGSEFFMGEENFISELSDADLNGVHGGIISPFLPSIVIFTPLLF
ncbi:hypothetical protein [Microseira wollei]|nr:hypothetical protein [Microseira wollei]